MQEGWENMEPKASSFEDAVNSYFEYPGYEKRIGEFGVHAIGLDTIKVWPFVMPQDLFYTFLNKHRPCEARALGPEPYKNYMHRGDIVAISTSQEPDNFVFMWINYVNHYPDLDSMLMTEGLNALVPGIETLDDAKAVYRGFYTPERIEEYGMAVFGIGDFIPAEVQIRFNSLDLSFYYKKISSYYDEKFQN